ncbi:tandem-95 repeat protein [Saccharophagus degradans]|uniref:tandem-95 repeat protein n=1 Tax=Saccharophagus degradans TaxID=86304 RepID=UPI001C082144|nr:tandem-95 repeat protein [Saccharophagus degradans]MBU2984802.1 tandem-95 repeat protein [Saccharophagus degradans]
MSSNVDLENKYVSKKYLTVKKVAQIALPVLAAFSGSASRGSNVSSVGKFSSVASKSYALNEVRLDPQPRAKDGAALSEDSDRRSVFSAFSYRQNSAQRVEKKNDVNDAVSYLEESGLLTPADSVRSNLSGDVYGLVGRKSFAHESQFDHCHGSFGSTYNTNTTTVSEVSCTATWGGVWETASPNPVVTATTIQNKTATSFDVAVTMSKASTVYAVLLESSKSAPTNTQVEAGTDGSGSAAAQTKSAAASNSVTLSFTGLDSNKNYLVYLIGKDASDNVTTTPVQVNPAYEAGLISNAGTWKFPKTRVDSSGNIYLAHASSGQINFLEWNGAGFSAVTTITAADVAGRTNMGWGNEHRVDYELDSFGNIHVIFNASTSQWAVDNDPFYGVYDGVNWTFTNIGETGNQGGQFDLFLDENDKAHLSFTLTPGADQVKYATNASGSWVISDVITATNDGTDEIHDTYCVVDSNGDAHIFYRREDLQNFSQDNYYYTSSSDNFATHTKIIDGKTDAKYYLMANVSIDSSDKIHYAYSNETDGDSFYVTNESGSWVSTEITHASHSILTVYDMEEEGGVYYFASASGSTYFFNSYNGTDWVDGFDFSLTGSLNDRVAVSDTADRIMVVSESSAGWEIHYHSATIASYITPPVSNEAPTITGLSAAFSTNEDAAAYIDMSAVTLADTEDDTVTLTLTVNSGALAASDGDGTTAGVTIANSGSASMTLTGAVADLNTYLDTTTKIQFTPTANISGAVTFTATPSDATSSGTAGTSSITVSAVNDDPTATGVPTDVAVTEDVQSNIDLSAITFADVDAASGNVVLSLAVTAGTLVASDSGGVTVGGSGGSTITLTGTVANIDTYLNTASNVQYTSAVNANGNDAATLSLTANDGGNTGSGGGGDVSLGTINLDIASVDDTPSDIALVASSINESDTSAGADVGTLSSTDADSGSFTYSLVNVGAADTGTCTSDVNNSSFQINTATLETANVLAAGNYDICVQTSDGNTSFEKSFSVTVVDNIAPVVTITSLSTADSTPALSGTVDDTAAAIQVTVNSANYVANNNANGTWILADNTIAALTHGTWDVAVTATDGASNVGSDATSNELVVDLEAPSSHSVSIDQANIDATNESAMSFTFAGAEVGASFSYSVSDGSANVTGSGTIASSDQQVTNINVSGLNETTLTLSAILTDVLGNAATAVTDTVVKQYNSAPVITEGASTSVNMSEDADPIAFALTLNASDSDADTITWSIGTNGSNGTAAVTGTGTTKAISYSPNANYFGVDSFVVEVSDGVATDQITVNVSIASINDAPVISGTPPTSVDEDSTYSFTPTASDVDVGDVLTYSVANAPSWVSFNTSNGELSGTPDKDDVGISSNIIISVNDGTVSESLASFNLTVVNTNDAPVITGTPSTSINEDSAYTFTPVVSDVDAGDTLVYSITNQPSWASFSTSTGLLSGTPGNDDVGTTTGIIIGVNDGTTTVNLASFNLTVVNTNDAPVISGTPPTSVDEDSTYSFTPTASDVDIGDVLTYSITNAPSWASFSTSTGQLIGTPENTDVGTDSNITISVSDGAETVSLASFNIEVSNVNDDPVATNDTAVTAEDTAVIVSVLTNDSDVDDALNPASVLIVSSPANGTTSLNTGSGAITYTPNADFNGSDSFTYTVEDATGATSNTATVAISISAENDAPVATSDTASTPEDTPFTIDVLVNDNDIDSGDSVDGATLVIASQPVNATASVVSGEIYFQPDEHFNGSTTFTYTVDDQNGATSNVATVLVNVTGVNDLPVAMDDSASLDEDGSVEVDVLANDTDIDGTIDPSTVSVLSDASNGGTSVNTTTGVITYTPTANFNGSDTFTYVVQDNDGGSSAATTVSVTVASINDAPNGVADTAALMEDNPTTINVLGNDSDVDGSIVVASVQIVTGPADGTVEVLANGSITYTPDTNYFGDDSFTYQVQDNEGAWSSETSVIVTVSSVNDAPLANNDSVSTDEDTAVSIDLIANDSDADGLIDSSSLVIVSAPANGALVDNLDGTVTYTPNADYFGSDSFTYQIDDDSGDSSNTAAVTIAINPVNDAPQLSGIPAASVNEDSVYSYTPISSDIEADDLSFSIENMPSWASFDTSNGALTGTPNNGAVGIYGGIIISVSDGVSSTSTSAFEIEVINTNDLPVLSGTPTPSVSQDQEFNFIPTAVDVDAGDTLTFSINSLPGWASFDPLTGQLSGSPNNAAVGLYTGIVISVSDGTSTVELPAFDITVDNVNDAPVAIADIYSVAEGGVLNGVNVLANDFDIDADGLTVTLISGPDSANSFSLSTSGAVSYMHDGSESIFDQFSYQISDGALQSAVVTVDIDIDAVNDAPVFVTAPNVLSLSQGQSYLYDIGVVDPDSVANLQLVSGPSWLTLNGSELSGEVPLDENVGLTSVVLRASDSEFTVDQNFDLSVVERETSVVSLSASWIGLPSVVDELLTLKIALNHQQGPAIADGNLLVVLTGSNFDASMKNCTALASNEFDCPVTLNSSGNLSFNLKLTPHSEGDVVVNLDVSDFAGDLVTSKIIDVSPSMRTVNQGDNAFPLDNATAIASIEMKADGNREIAAGTGLGDTIKLLDYETGSDEATVLGEIENRGATKALGVADIDLDGSEDLLVVNTAGDATAVYYQRGELNFVEDSATASLPYANQGVLQDLNSDNYPELILGGSGFNLYIYENILGVYSQSPYVFTSQKSIKKFTKLKQKPDQAPMSGTLVLASSDALVLIDFAIAAGKVTKVGVKDSGEVQSSNKLQVHQSSELSIPGITSIRVADLDGDGVEELIVSTRHENNSSSKSGVTIIEVSGTGQMTEVRKLGNASAENVEIADFNGDGLPDLLIANENNTYQFYHGDGTVSGFSLKDTVIYNESDLVLPNDVNEDGLSDLLIYVAESDRVDLYISDSDGDLGARADLTMSSQVETVSSTSYDIRQLVSVTNSGSQTAQDVMVTIDIPVHFNVVSLPDACLFDDAQIICDLGDLTANQSETLTFVLNGDADVNDEVLLSRVTSAALEVAPENNKSTNSLNGLFESTSAGVKGGASGSGAINFGLLCLLLILGMQKKMKYWRQLMVVSLLLLMCGQSHGEPLLNSERMSVEMGIGSASSNWSESSFLAELQAVTQDVEITRVKTTRTSWQLIGGYELNNWFSAEAGYQSWGDVDVELSLTTNDPEGVRGVLAKDYPVSGAGPYLGARIQYDVSEGILIYVRAGVLAWQGEYDVRVGESVQSIKRDGVDLAASFGVNKSLNDNVAFGLGLNLVELAGETQTQVGLQVRYKFLGKRD